MYLKAIFFSERVDQYIVNTINKCAIFELIMLERISDRDRAPLRRAQSKGWSLLSTSVAGQQTNSLYDEGEKEHPLTPLMYEIIVAQVQSDLSIVRSPWNKYPFPQAVSEYIGSGATNLASIIDISLR